MYIQLRSDTQLDHWPKPAGRAMLEPGSGFVTLRRRGIEPIRVSTAEARALADAAPARLGTLLRTCAEEADRQEQQLTAAMAEPGWRGGTR